MLLNSDKQLDLQAGRFLVFELGNIKDNPILFAVTTLIIMSTFIAKMRRLQGVRKAFFVTKRGKASPGQGWHPLSSFCIKRGVSILRDRDHYPRGQRYCHLAGRPRKYRSELGHQILLDMKKYMQRFDTIQELLGLSAKEKAKYYRSTNRTIPPAGIKRFE